MKIEQKVLLVILFLLSSCGEKYREYYENGSLKEECEVRDNHKHGQCVQYYMSGDVKEESQWQDGRLNGVRIKYDSLGNVLVKSEFVNGEIRGKVEYYEDGVLESIYNYERNLPNGEFVKLSRGGEIIERGQFIDGNQYGVFFYFNADGNLKGKRQYIINGGEAKLNQYWSYSDEGVLQKDQSNFVTFSWDDHVATVEFNPLFGDESLIVLKDSSNQVTQEIVLFNNRATIPLNQPLQPLKGFVEDRQIVADEDTTKISIRRIFFDFADSTSVL